jgi:hypothetical protein
MRYRQISRRLVLAGTSVSLLPRRLRADTMVGVAVGVTGNGLLARAGGEAALQRDDALFEGDQIRTLSQSLAELLLFTQTRINLGPDSTITIDRFLADMGGIVEIGGAIVFDRPEDLPKIDLTLQSAFAQIGVRGTRFFAGPSNGVQSVFVERGAVRVTSGGEVRELAAGDGVDLPAPGAPPSAVVRWKPKRIAAAFASVGL